VKPRTLLWLLLGALGLAAAPLTTGTAAVFTGQAQNHNNTFSTAPCFPGDTGLLNPTTQAPDTGAGDGDGFEQDPTNAFADDASYAANYDGQGDRHFFYDYNISIPSGCSVSGIEVRLDWWLDSTMGINSTSVEVSWDGGTSWTAAKTDSTETTEEHTAVLGGSADTWGRGWTPTELGNGDFWVRITSNSDDSSRDFFLEWVPVRVSYGP
jgi:hypothetical protein